MKKGIVIGVTGCIGVGKSTAIKILGRLGAETVTADDIVRENYIPGKMLYKAMIDILGKDILKFDQTIDRKAITSKIKKQEDLIYKINDITHPTIIGKIRKKLSELKKKAVVIALEVPLLFEVGMEQDVDITLVISASDDIVIERVTERMGWTESLWQLFKRHQFSQEQKMNMADYVIYNDGDIADLERQLILFWENTVEQLC
ncbi:dephospho-CoA kinase [bacterium]